MTRWERFMLTAVFAITIGKFLGDLALRIQPH